MILLIDNYDSFVFNLARYLQRLGQTTHVVRNDQVSLDRIVAGEYHAIVISPGPQAPDQAGCCLEVVKRFSPTIPILGVCLGHQAICQAFGARIVRAPHAVHGRASWIQHSGSRLLAGLPSPFAAARYHSLLVDRATLPAELVVTATTDSTSKGLASSHELVMAVEHSSFATFGVQLHPESILSEVGYSILERFLSLAGVSKQMAIPNSDLDDPSSLQALLRQSNGIEDSMIEVEVPPAVLPQSRLR